MRVKLSDFGIARNMDSSITVTFTDRIAGTFAYMSDEARDGEFSTASDMYALGIVAHQVGDTHCCECAAVCMCQELTVVILELVPLRNLCTNAGAVRPSQSCPH
jgi:serine/threonine protein kinase